MILLEMLLSCKKDSFSTLPTDTLRYSADTIRFDTVFTSVGSVTKSFKIFNDHDQKIRISTIKLMGGNSTAFSMNVNGQATNEFNNFVLEANDSMYVFVAVHINPNSLHVPFIVSDSILINYNGNEQFVQLQAYGQNAHFIRNQTISGNQTWVNDLPYVIEGNLHIDTTAHLQIEAGCLLYMHANGQIIVDGQLTAIGNINNTIQFKGDRLDVPYRNMPGSWPGIYFRNESHDNQLIFVNIQNAQEAVKLEGSSVNNTPKLLIQQCIIDNASIAGINIIESSLSANNTLISNCGKNLSVALGGNYQFTNCTFSSYSTLYALHQHPVAELSNYQFNNGSVFASDLTAQFTNCIFWGDGGTVEDEILLLKQGNQLFDVTLQNCLYKASTDPTPANIVASIKNIDPLFDSIDPGNHYFDFHFKHTATSPLMDAGTHTNFLSDLDDLIRESGPFTDIGCYEKQ
jgi:hypothetical protein